MVYIYIYIYIYIFLFPKIMGLAHLEDVYLKFYLAVNKLIINKI